MLIDSYRNMIVSFASPATRGFLSPFLSLSCLVSSWRKKTSWDQGTREYALQVLTHLTHYSQILVDNEFDRNNLATRLTYLVNN